MCSAGGGSPADIALEDDQRRLRLDVKTVSATGGGTPIEYPSTMANFDFGIEAIETVEVTFTDRWDETTTETLSASIDRVDLGYHQDHGVDWVLQDTTVWQDTHRRREAADAVIDLDIVNGVAIYLQATVPQPTYDLEVEDLTVDDDYVLRGTVRATQHGDITDHPAWTDVDTVLTVMNRGQIQAVELTIEGTEAGPHEFFLDI